MISKAISTIIILSIVSMIPATPIAASQTRVSVNAPERVDGDFIVVIEIENAADLDSGQFDLAFDSDAVNVTGVDDGFIDGTVIPIDNWAVDEDRIKVLFNLPGIDGVSGSGSLATIHFETIVPGDCTMKLSDGLLVDTMAEAIPASWDGVESVVSEAATNTRTRTSIPADTTESRSSGFGALLAVGVLAAVIFAFRRK